VGAVRSVDVQIERDAEVGAPSQEARISITGEGAKPRGQEQPAV